MFQRMDAVVDRTFNGWGESFRRKKEREKTIFLNKTLIRKKGEGEREKRVGEEEEERSQTTGGSDLKSPVVSFAGRENNWQGLKTMVFMFWVWGLRKKKMGRKKSSHVHNAPSDDDNNMYSKDSKPKRIYQLWPGNNVGLPFPFTLMKIFSCFLQATVHALYWWIRVHF